MRNRVIQVCVGIALAVAAAEPSCAGTLYNGWNYVVDPGNDSLASNGNGGTNAGGTVYEIYGMAIKDDVDTDSIWIALNANLSLLGNSVPTNINGFNVPDGNIGWGDLFFDFSGTGNFKAASDASNLYGIRFAGTNDSQATSIGVYSNVAGFWNGWQNAGYWTLESHNSTLNNLSGNQAVTGDLAWNDPYYNLNSAPLRTPNVIASGTRIGDIEFVETLDLIGQGFDVGFFPEQGSETIGFRFDKSLFPSADYIATLILECINDAIAAAGNFVAPPPPPPPPPAPSICEITPGQLNPLQPDRVEGNTKIFENVVSGEWYDPPGAMGFQYNVENPSLFTAILDFPCGLDKDDAFNVFVGGINLGSFSPGQTLKFEDFPKLGNLLVGGIGVQEFTVTDIDLPDDSDKATDFFLKLAFNTPNASFTITRVPEPSNRLSFVILVAIGIVMRLARRKK